MYYGNYTQASVARYIPTPAEIKRGQTRATLSILRRLIVHRVAGHAVSYTTDPTWLVNMAINRRAGWPDDPGYSRGSCRPVSGHYPHKAIGETYNHLRLLAGRINTPRLIVRSNELGEWRKLLMRRLPHRFTRVGE